MALHKSVKLPRQILRRQLAQTEEEWDENEGEFEAGDYDGEDEAEFEAFDTDNAGEVFGSSKAQDGEDETEEYLGEFENTKSSSKVKSNDKTGSKKQSIFEDEAEDENENDTPQLVFDRDDEKVTMYLQFECVTEYSASIPFEETLLLLGRTSSHQTFYNIGQSVTS